MKSCLIKPVLGRIRGALRLSGDKSIAHRAVILGALSASKTQISNFPVHNDSLATIGVFRSLGIKITPTVLTANSNKITVFGRGLYGLRAPKNDISVGESGTTLRLLCGVIAGQNFKARLVAGKSLSKRPMLRITQPLRKMGAKISAKKSAHGMGPEEYPPLIVKGGHLKGIKYNLLVGSAQVKSAVLLAALFAKGTTTVIDKFGTRDHTERMLKAFKAPIKFTQNSITIKKTNKLVSPGKIYIPSDISSAAFFIVLATITKDSRILLEKIGLNPTRTGVINVLNRMGASIKITNIKPNAEPVGDLIVTNANLKSTIISSNEVPSLIDELPILMVAACFARGKTVFKGVQELRVKETDRIKSMVGNLKKMGANIRVVRRQRSEDIVVKGVSGLFGCAVSSFGDHRTAMSMIVAGLAAQGTTKIDDVACINKSFPDFIDKIRGFLH